MKRILIFIMLALTCLGSRAAFSVSPSSFHPTVPDYLLVKNFISMTVSEFQTASGHKMNIFQKMYFKKLQRKLSRLDAPANASILSHYDVQKGKFKFDLLWFVLGCIIGPFALLFAFTSKQKKNKRLSALIGFGVFVLWFGWLFLF